MLKNSDYSDILNTSRPVSTRKKIPLRLRAAQFSPFDALGDIDYNFHPRSISTSTTRLTPSDPASEESS